MININEVLMQSFRSHGHPEAAIDGEWVIIPNYPLARAFAHPFQSGSEFVNVQLDIEIALNDGRVIGESVAGLGNNLDEAIENGFSKFLVSSFHALLCVFYDYPVDEQINYEEWVIRGDTWEVFMGPLGAISVRDGGTTSSRPDLSEISPDDLSSFAENQIKSRTYEGDLHWVRFYHAHQSGAPMASEVLWDNEVWQECQHKLSRLNWPVFKGFSSIRMFVILRKKGTTNYQRPSGNARDIEQGLSLLVDYCTQHPMADAEEIYQHLLSAGIAPDLSDRILVFGPMCFSSLILREFYPTEFIICSEETQSDPINLINEPVFAVGQRYAMTIAGNKDIFMAVAGRCAVLNAANQALHQGAKLENLIASPAMVFLNESSFQHIPKRTIPKPRPYQPPSRPASGRAGTDAEKKPWWRFW